MISFVEANELLRYEPASGRLFWRLDRTAGVRAGDEAGTGHHSGYVHVCIGGRSYLAHRIAWLLAMGGMPAAQIDHINGDRADNRLCNLREATPSQNMHNRKFQSNNTTGFTGVVHHKGKFGASIKLRGKRTYLGYFYTAEEAGAAYQAASRKYHGDFAGAHRK